MIGHSTRSGLRKIQYAYSNNKKGRKKPKCSISLDLQLNDYELRKGKRVGVTISFNNHRLFVGNIPKNRDREELLDEFTKHARKFRRHPAAESRGMLEREKVAHRLEGTLVPAFSRRLLITVLS